MKYTKKNKIWDSVSTCVSLSLCVWCVNDVMYVIVYNVYHIVLLYVHVFFDTHTLPPKLQHTLTHTHTENDTEQFVFFIYSLLE